MRAAMGGVAALLLLSGCGTPAAVADDEEPKLAEMIQEAQRAGSEKHDLKKFLAVWADDAKLIAGRTEKPDKYDTVLTRAQLEATHKLYFAVPPPKDLKLEYEGVKTDVKGSEATVRYRVSLGTGGITHTAEEVVRLRRKDGVWKVYEKRSWPVQERGDDFTTPITAETWKDRDNAVTKTTTPHDRWQALWEARRFAEAHAAAKAWTDKKPKAADVWVTRGYTAMQVGDVADARASFKKALELDPKVFMADYARKAVAEK